MKKIILLISLCLSFQSAMAIEVSKLVNLDLKALKSIGTESHGRVEITSDFLTKKSSDDDIKGIKLNVNKKIDLDLTTENILDIETQSGKVLDAKNFGELFGAFPQSIRIEARSLSGIGGHASEMPKFPGTNIPVLVPRTQLPGINGGTLRSNDIILGGGGRVILDEF